MHIMEGFLPAGHALGWSLASAPVVVYGVYSLGKKVRKHPEYRMLLGVAAAFTFILSALKIPSISGSCSHPTGTGFGALLFGPTAMAPIGLVVLLFQALLLAHGGITTLGANVFSMAIVGPFVAYGVFRLARVCCLPFGMAVFLAAFSGNLMTYLTTSAQLALAFPDPTGGFITSFVKFASIFALTQLPLAIIEGMLTVLIFNALKRFNPQELRHLNLLQVRGAQR